MGRYLLQRLAQSLLVLFGASLLVFILVRVVPSDPVDLMTPPGTSEQLKDIQRHALGLDRPLVVQYAIFVRDAVRGDFGTSFRFNQPAAALVIRAFPATL